MGRVEAGEVGRQVVNILSLVRSLCTKIHMHSVLQARNPSVTLGTWFLIHFHKQSVKFCILFFSFWRQGLTLWP